MDNGQPKQTNKWGKNEPIFFTAGEGRRDPEVNPDLSNSLQDDIFNSDPQDVGRNVIRSNRFNEEPRERDRLASQEESHDIAGSPINVVVPDQNNSLNQSDPSEIEKRVIKTYEHLSKEGVQEVERMLNKDIEDPADFYAKIRKMTEDNLNNSYGEASAWKGPKAA